MFNLGLYFQTLDSIKTKVLLNLGLKGFVIRANKSKLIIYKYEDPKVYLDFDANRFDQKPFLFN